MTDRPNILFLMSDEHRHDVAGFAGNRIVRTPTLDALASTGVVFRNAYAPSPICVPSRQCLMAGQLPRTCRCLGWVDLPRGHETFARHFTRHGWATAAFGKLHHLGQDQMMGWSARPAGDVRVGLGALGVSAETAEACGVRPFADLKWSIPKEIQRAGVGRPGYQRDDDLAVRAFENWVTSALIGPWYDRHQPRQPKLLKVSLIQPHYPFMTDEERFCYYLNRVEPFADDGEPWHPLLTRDGFRASGRVSDRDARRATAAYYGMVDRVDTEFGNVLETLRNAGEDLDDWIIVYTSDHGEMLGEHGVWEKQSFHEGSVKVPLVIRWPRRFPARIIDENVSLCDLFATLCDLSGLDVPPGLDSRSLAPLLEGRTAGWSNESVSAIWDTHLMIRRDHLKYCYYSGLAPEVLFDLAADPGETRNVIDAPEYAVAVAAFRQRRGALGYGPDGDAGYVNAGY